MVPIAVLINIPVTIMCFSYLAYCLFHGGFHLKHRGWRTAQENPRMFYFVVIIVFLVGLFNLVIPFMNLR